jgi:hypothetical protein
VYLRLVDRFYDGVDNAGVRQLQMALVSCLLRPSLLLFIPRGSLRGQLTVDVSPNWSSSPDRIFLRIRLIILPDLVFGRSLTTYTAFGAANGPIDLRTCIVRLFLISDEFSNASFRDTKALTVWPVNSSAIPTTAASATASVGLS